MAPYLDPPVPNPAVSSVELDGERVLYDADRGRVVRLDRVASLIWPLLDGVSTADELAEDLSDVFGRPLSEVRADLEELFDGLGRSGYLNTGKGAGGSSAPPPAPNAYLADPPDP